ncbi:unnamed protein product [Pleuronectes platessa]|uniref:Uncharacterized protein n=1 Tax=Pleuronectes platessa TaxID=8262 RepID=A0A9N7Z446_PLEPL|nr:unnamed protein product [Pleuronectes platessa]
MGSIKPCLSDVDWEEAEETSSGDGRGLVLPLMDGLRNGPYRMCHTASGDVLMCSRGEGVLQRRPSMVQERSRRGERRSSVVNVSRDFTAPTGRALQPEIRTAQIPTVTQTPLCPSPPRPS